MEIYVQSAGVSEEQDYCWQEIKDNSQESVEEPGLVTDFKHLLQTESPSILIVRKNNQLILLVTGMKASKRKDYRGRTIRNSVAFIADEDNERDEQTICGIAVHALRDKLENIIDKLIVEGENCGFKVYFEISVENKENIFIIYFKELDKNVDELCIEVNNQANIPELKIGKNSKDNKEKIDRELAALKLPTVIEQPALVVVTGIKAEDTLTDAEVWRGLSNLVEEDELSTYPKKIAFNKIFQKENNKKFENSSKALTALMIIIPTFFIILALLITEPKNRETIAFALNITTKPNGQSVEIYKSIKNISSKYDVKEFIYEKVAVINPQNSQSVNNSNSQLFSLKHDAEVKSVAISADGQYIVTGDDQGRVWLWDANGNSIAKPFAAHKQGVVLLAINVNSQTNNITVVSSDITGKVNIWKPQINNKSGN